VLAIGAKAPLASALADRATVAAHGTRVTSTPIVATKVRIPRSPTRMVPRPHLIERLDDGLEHSLTLVSAPAGFGKTSLVSTWAAGCTRQVAWL